MRVDKYIDHPSVDLLFMHHDLLVPLLARGIRLGQFQPIQRALAGQRLAPIRNLVPVLSQRIGFLHRHRQHRIQSQLIVIVQILISQTQPIDPLPQQLPNRVLDCLRVAVIAKTFSESGDDPRPLFRLLATAVSRRPM